MIKRYMLQKIILIATLLLNFSALFSQNKISKDSVVKRDSAYLYKEIQKFAYKRTFTHWLYRTAFREIQTEVEVTGKSNSQKEISKKENFKKQQGKFIRNIRIVTIDPLGKVVGDTIAVGRSWLEKTGNKTHFTTRRLAVKNQLLFKEGDSFDSLRLIESERLLRQTGYLSEAKIKTFFTSKKKDSLDVLVTVRDLWTINGSATVSASANSMEFSEKNVLGLGHLFRNAIFFDIKSSPSFNSVGSYLIPNIKHSFVAGTIFYNASAYNQGVGISLDRSFFSPVIRWAGGIMLSTNHVKIPYVLADSIIQRFDAQYYTQDIWLGQGFKVSTGKFNAYRDPRVLLTARIYNMQYNNRPSFEYDTLKANRGTLFYLSSISFSYRNYYKDKNIYQFGRTEDVPEGRLFSIIGGFKVNEFSYIMPYYGFKFSYGKHINNLGYLATNFEYGSFLNNGKNIKGVINTGIHFFNDLWTYHKWNMRQFVDFRTTMGMHRDSAERININGSNGLEGFDSQSLKGFNKSVLTFANVLYWPYKWIGFQFATVLFASFATIGNTNTDLLKGQVYQAYGFGILIRNEFMVIKTIQISFGYYPFAPGQGNDVFKYNSLKVTDLIFTDLYFSKPEFIGYN